MTGREAGFGPKFFAYLRWETHDEETGKYNGGQKLCSGTAAWPPSGCSPGVVLWFPGSFPRWLRELAVSSTT